MAIIETKIVVRPNTSTPFFSQTSNLAQTQVRDALGPFTVESDTATYYKRTNASGSHVIEYSYSTDLITQTNKMTFDSIATWSTVDSATSIALDKEYFAYAEANGFTHPAGQYTLTGIDAPFTCTTTYTYDSNSDSFFDIFTSSLEVSDKLTSFTNTGSQLIAVHTYTNAADFTENHWRDNSFVAYLNESGITRTIEYAMVSNDA
jgi:hypothetical protein